MGNYINVETNILYEYKGAKKFNTWRNPQAPRGKFSVFSLMIHTVFANFIPGNSVHNFHTERLGVTIILNRPDNVKAYFLDDILVNFTAVLA